MRKLLVTVALGLALMAAPRVATAGVGISIGIGLPFPGVVFAGPPMVYGPPIAYGPPPVVYGGYAGYGGYGPPVVYRRAYAPRPVFVRPYPVRHWRGHRHGPYRY